MHEQSPTFTTDLAVMSWLVIFVAVPLFILMAFLVIRFLLKRNAIHVLVFGIVAGIASLLLVMFLTVRGPGEAVHQEASILRTSPARQAKLIQPKPVITTAPVMFKPFSEQPLVARKPDDSVAGSEDGMGQSKLEKPEPLPDWVVTGLETTKQNQSNLLESSRPVYQSGLFATREEAMQDALTKSMQPLQENIFLRNPNYNSRQSILNPQLIRQFAYRKVHYQTVEHDFGNVLKSGESFKRDMYRAYLEIEDSPAVRQALFNQWKQKIGNERTVWLGGGFGLMTLICAGVAIYLRAAHDPDTIR